MSGEIVPLIQVLAPALASSAVAIRVVDRLADYLGERRQPQRILNEAEAEAYADAKTQLIRQSHSLEAGPENRQMARALFAEVNRANREQKNNESIVAKALGEVKEDAKPEEVEDDWFANFFDKSRLVSDEEMQILWAKVLSGEVNEPGAFSSRALNFLASFSRTDVRKFLLLCRFSVQNINQKILPLIYDERDAIFEKYELTFDLLKDIDGMGLIHYDPSHKSASLGFCTHFTHTDNYNLIYLFYNSSTFVVDSSGGIEFSIGRVILTDLGDQISRLCSPEPIAGFDDYIVNKWMRLGHKVSIHNSDVSR